MKWKQILKTLVISFTLVLIALAGLLFWGLSKLPSAFDIKQALTPPALKSASKTVAPEKSQDSSQTANPSAPAAEATPTNATDNKSEKEKLSATTLKVLTEDFADPRKPLVESCRHLAEASESRLLRDSNNASAKYFFESLAQDQRDPLVETAAPILRYIFRAPGMQSVVDMIVKAEETKDLGFIKKAEFYYELYRAGDFLKAHKENMDAILQKTYNLHHLAKAVAQKPELARDAATLNFCDQIEKNVNDDEVYNADEASKEMLKFFKDAGIDPHAIGYDPAYRSKVTLNVSNTQLNINDSWMIKLFARDIEKAQKESKKTTNERL